MPPNAPPRPAAYWLRILHRDLSLFFAPVALLFAITGGLQVLDLHTAHGAYRPPPVVEKLGEVHKHQRYALRRRRPVPLQTATETGVRAAPQENGKAPDMALRHAAFVVLAVGVALSASLGVALALTARTGKLRALFLLGAGVLAIVAALCI